ncbi:hypothetical protein [Falsirhodobacter algicola]|uniref:Uncharacterized protein n=1 Tax=Falsirhodobacter algicola TaxID=2692330 RepID=A0A8J8MS16_9RHOB|nr:hypothetical protein [Falsirhodobacter algicola]QUS35243.1 hypothetical protein GR316_02510 [Falsirhodobacter algicola]
MNPIWLLRMSQWVRHPPPMWKVILVVCVVLACFALFLIERYVGWPDWMTLQGGSRMKIRP